MPRHRMSTGDVSHALPNNLQSMMSVPLHKREKSRSHKSVVEKLSPGMFLVHAASGFVAGHCCFSLDSPVKLPLEHCRLGSRF